MSNESPDLSTLDHEALARMVAELQGELAEEKRQRLQLREIANVGIEEMSAFANVMMADKKLLRQAVNSLEAQLAAARAEVRQVQAHSKSVEGLLLNAQRWLDAFKTYWMELTRATGVFTTSHLTNDLHLAALRWIQHARVEVDRLPAADNPDFDATDGAHPAWWRGHDHTTKVFCALVNDILDGKDDGSGANREPWASTRKRLLDMRAEIEQTNRSYAILQESFADLNKANARDIQECGRLRAALAQVGERIKNEVEAKLTQIEGEIKERRYNEMHQAALGAIRRAFLLVSQIDLAAIVAASAGTAGASTHHLRCSNCGGSASPMRKDSRNQIACDSCFQKWEFHDEKYRNEWQIVGVAAEGQEAGDGKG